MSNPTAFKCGQPCNTYIELWSVHTKGIDEEIEDMLNNSRDPITRAVLRYILFLRSKSKDVLIKWNAKKYNPISGKVSCSPSRLVLLHAIPSGNAYWLYFYILGVGDFTVLKAKKSNSLETFLQVAYGHVIKLYTISGKVYHFTGINKSKRYGSRNNPVKYRYQLMRKVRTSIPCITEDDFERYKAYYKSLLGYLGIVPPLIIELPPYSVNNRPSVGLILPVKYDNVIRTYILPIDTLLTLSASTFSTAFNTFSSFVDLLDNLSRRHNLFPLFIKAENITCKGLLRYLYYRKSINVYLTLLMNELRASLSDISKAINNYVNLIYELHSECKCDCSLHEYINKVWENMGGKTKKVVIQDLLNNADSAAKLLNYLPKPIAIGLYGLDYIKRVIKALLCLLKG
jgi:hypothetical protein